LEWFSIAKLCATFLDKIFTEREMELNEWHQTQVKREMELASFKPKLEEKWNWHQTQVVSCFLDLRRTNYMFLKLKCNGHLNDPPPEMHTACTLMMYWRKKNVLLH